MNDQLKLILVQVKTADIDTEWGLLRDAVLNSANDAIGFRERKHKDWFDNNDV
jgi:hypothetical protein